MNRYIHNIEPPKARPLMLGDHIWWREEYGSLKHLLRGEIIGEVVDMDHDDWLVRLKDGAKIRVYKRENIHKI